MEIFLVGLPDIFSIPSPQNKDRERNFNKKEYILQTQVRSCIFWNSCKKRGQEAPKYVYLSLLSYSQVAGVDVAGAALVHIEALDVALEVDVARAL